MQSCFFHQKQSWYELFCPLSWGKVYKESPGSACLTNCPSVVCDHTDALLQAKQLVLPVVIIFCVITGICSGLEDGKLWFRLGELCILMPRRVYIYVCVCVCTKPVHNLSLLFCASERFSGFEKQSEWGYMSPGVRTVKRRSCHIMLQYFFIISLCRQDFLSLREQIFNFQGGKK